MEKMIFIGYAPGSKAYLFMRNTGRTFTSSTAIFDESDFPKCKNSSIESSLVKRAIDIPLPSSLQHDTNHFITDRDADQLPNPEENPEDHPAAPDLNHGDLDDQTSVDNVPIPAPVPHQQIELQRSTRPSHIPNRYRSVFGTHNPVEIQQNTCSYGRATDTPTESVSVSAQTYENLVDNPSYFLTHVEQKGGVWHQLDSILACATNFDNV
uniref:Retroviral polymerase SH3-like domain-containing protein n=1 Tax=Moniliophthora roreri TaxID=221103 RepID=A0A0W0EVQ8_MONRR